MSTTSPAAAVSARSVQIIAKNNFERSVKLQFRGFEYQSSSCTWHDDLHMTFSVHPRIGVWIVDCQRDIDFPKGNKKSPMRGYRRVTFDAFKRLLENAGFKVTRESTSEGYHTVIA
jgi:hypothetical protein